MALGGASRLDVPLKSKSFESMSVQVWEILSLLYLSISEVLQSQLVCELAGAHGLREVLLVGEHQQHRVS